MNIAWYINRLRAMSLPEIRWRLEQKRIAGAERRVFEKQHTGVNEAVFYTGLEDLVFHPENLPLYRVKQFTASDRILLPGGFQYEAHKKDWHGGFQTPGQWEPVFSGDLSYKQRDEIGDARTNWELNRHFQFALLACDYYQTGRTEYVTELQDLFQDWNRQNPFLHGISWTSVMEVAIRDINWIYTLGFLQASMAEGKQKKDGQAGHMISGLCEGLRQGTINMTAYISAHFSRYSSANNHVIVEAAAMGIGGIVMDCGEWLETACMILRTEIPRQNYRDGVNREVSLHYQSFFMEAVGLLVLTMKTNGLPVPQNWRNLLTRMSRYLADCQGDYGETVEFGDNDEGKILDLQGTHRNHYRYVLELMSVVLPERYMDTVTDQTLLCIVSPDNVEKLPGKPCYHPVGCVCYPEGGVSIFRSRDRKALIGVDHGALGFGSIAAHGHADALSFQMYLEGWTVFADAGTYLYHIDLENRNAFRSTEHHNTVTVGGRDQSEMLGPFLWGRRAETRLLGCNCFVREYGKDSSVPESMREAVSGEAGEESGWLYLAAEHDGYAPVLHQRRFVFDGECCLKIYDALLHVKQETAFRAGFLVGKGWQVQRTCETGEEAGDRRADSSEDAHTFVLSREGGQRVTCSIRGESLQAEICEAEISTEYGIKEHTKRLCISGRAMQDTEMVTIVQWEKQT